MIDDNRHSRSTSIEEKKKGTANLANPANDLDGIDLKNASKLLKIRQIRKIRGAFKSSSGPYNS